MRRSTHSNSQDPKSYSLKSGKLPALRDVHEIRHVIGLGGAVVVPSDTAYAIVTDPFKALGRETLKILSLANQTMTPLAFGSAAQVHRFLPLNAGTDRVLHALAPGAITLVARLPDTVSQDRATDVLGTPGTIGLRVPDSPVQCALSTEANRPLSTALRTPDGEIVRDWDVAFQLLRQRAAHLARPDLVGIVRDVGFGCDAHSTVIEIDQADFVPATVKIHRVGAIEEATIKAAARDLGPTDFEDWT